MTKRFCPNGHDTDVYGRASNGRCKECKRMGERKGAVHVGFEEQRLMKVARALIRLKHSLAADAEIKQVQTEVRAALLNGEVPRLITTLGDLVE
jgi:hypothetical protein